MRNRECDGHRTGPASAKPKPDKSPSCAGPAVFSGAGEAHFADRSGKRVLEFEN